jgi:diadenosine tetraphosphate (Ap4A) HIT family hydrolase
MKKILIALLVLTAIYFVWPDPTYYSSANCPFCNPTILNAQTFYEDDLTLGLCTNRPKMPGHCLVIPKRHVERFEDLTDEESVQICRVLKKVDRAVSKTFNTSSYLLLQKNGRESAQTVPHVHFHYIPRKAGDYIGLGYLIKSSIIDLLPPISPTEMDHSVEKMKAAME